MLPRGTDHCDLAKREVGSPIAGVMASVTATFYKFGHVTVAIFLSASASRGLMATIAGQAVHAVQRIEGHGGLAAS